jgi:hypothetical protein
MVSTEFHCEQVSRGAKVTWSHLFRAIPYRRAKAKDPNLKVGVVGNN